MSRQLFWRMFLVFATGVVALFYVINQLSSKTEEGMSFIAKEHRQLINQWGQEAEKLYNAREIDKLNQWLENLRQQEKTWVSVVAYDFEHIAGAPLPTSFFGGYNMGRNIDWKIHLYFPGNPTMEVPFQNQQVSFLIKLPERMRPGSYWRYTKIVMHIIIPTILLALISYLLYRYIMKPLLQLQAATRHFSAGNLDIRASELMGGRQDEFSDLAQTFDRMAITIGEQIISQRHLIADLSHELRTPLTRLDIALSAIEQEDNSKNIERIKRDSKHIRRLVDDTLTLAWLDNEKPQLSTESVNLIDLLDVLIDDAKFEFPKHVFIVDFPQSATIENSCHRAAGQALENILRNALRYTPIGKSVTIELKDLEHSFEVSINDQGQGVDDSLLTAIFKPFFRVDKSRERDGSSFGLGLALAERQLATVRATVYAKNLTSGGLSMIITFPK